MPRLSNYPPGVSGREPQIVCEPDVCDHVLWLGIDPGAHGGLASIGGSGSARAQKMPSDEKEIWQWFNQFGCFDPREVKVFAVIEKVSGFVGKNQPGSSMFHFGQSYGFLRGCLVASGIPFEEVTPQKWQKALGISPRVKHNKTVEVVASKGKRKGELIERRVGGETDLQWKGRLKAKSQRLFPDLEVTLATADALLIAEYCRRRWTGTSKPDLDSLAPE